MYEYGTLKPAEITLRRGRGKGRIMEEMTQNSVHHMHIWKYHSETSCTIIIY
jgi:hypothetical protein